MSAVTSRDLDQHLQVVTDAIATTKPSDDDIPGMALRADALTKAPRPVIAWHVCRVLGRVLTRSSR